MRMSRYIDADLMQDCLVEMNDENDWVVNKYNADWIYIDNRSDTE